jgi:CRP-like cAMP-binding protein
MELDGRLSKEDRRALTGLPFRCRALTAGVSVDPETDDAASCGVLVSGFAYSGRILRDGARQIVSVHVPGDFFGLGNLFQSFGALEVRMLTPGAVARIEVTVLQRLMNDRPTIQKIFWRQTAFEASMFSEWLTGIGRRDAQSRIAHFLCEFAVRLRGAGLSTSDEFDLPLTQEQLADVTGLTPVHVNRVFHALRASGVVELERRSVTIRDWAGLAEMADFDPAYLKGRAVRA